MSNSFSKIIFRPLNPMFLVLKQRFISFFTGSILQKVIVISCWVFCFVCSSPYLKYYEAKYYGQDFSFGDQQQCILNFGDTDEEIIKGHTV